MEVREKLKAIRRAEGLNQDDFAHLIGVTSSKIKNFEQGRTASMLSEDLVKITNHPRFKKYTLWLMNGEVAPESGQISPDIEQVRTA